MKVAFETSCLTQEGLTGIGQYSVQLFRALRQQNVNVEPVIKISRLLKRRWTQIHLGTRARLFHPCARVGLGRYDVFHGPDFRVPYVSSLAKVATIHDLAVFEESFHDPDTALRGRRDFTCLIRKMRPDLIVTVSKFSEKELHRYFPETQGRTRVVYPGADHFTSNTQSNLQSSDILNQINGKKFVLYVGSVEARKNTDRVLEAFAHSRLVDTGHHLVVVGAAGYSGADFIRAWRGRPQIHFLGFQSQANLATLYRSAQFFVFPSLYEGFGFPILEAMSFGLPVLTSQTTACAEVAGDAAICVNPLSVTEIREAMESLAQDSHRLAELRQRGFQRAQSFSWQKSAKDMQAVYFEAAGLKGLEQTRIHRKS